VISKLKFRWLGNNRVKHLDLRHAKHFSFFSLTSLKLHESTFSDDFFLDLRSYDLGNIDFTRMYIRAIVCLCLNDDVDNAASVDLSNIVIAQDTRRETVLKTISE